MKVDAILGLQWGDEGKGKIVDALAPEYDIIARFQGGPNAGHTLIFNDQKFVLHSVPSGIFRTGILNIIGNGVVLDPLVFYHEIDMIRNAGFNPVENLIISSHAHLITPSHRLLDAVQEASLGSAKIGSTLKGIGPAYTDKYGRKGLRAGMLKNNHFNDAYQTLRSTHFSIIERMGGIPEGLLFDGLTFNDYEKHWLESARKIVEFRIAETEIELNLALRSGKKVLAEGAQGTLLDVDFGSYPFVTSSNTMAGGICTGLGVPPSSIGKIFGVFKAYCTRVGNGPFPTELNDDMGETIRKNGHEFGSTTGRPRRTGWLDLPALRYAVMINGVTDLVMTKADVLSGIDPVLVCDSYAANGQSFLLPAASGDVIEATLSEHDGWKEDLSKCSSFESLPESFSKYVDFIEKNIGVPVSVVSTGPGRNQLIKNTAV